MKIHIDDWHFRTVEKDLLVLDLYLENGQHALLEVTPLINPRNQPAAVPEMVVFCEMPGEKLNETRCEARWLSRPPNRECVWSHVEIPPALAKQIHEKLGIDLATEPVTPVV